MSARPLAFAAGLAFALSALAGLALMRWRPGAAGLGAVALALALAVACLHLAVATPRAGPPCAACGRARDGALTFCARCGAA